jgi:hypothetical protein
MAADGNTVPFDIARVATARHLGVCASVHKLGSPLRILAIAAAAMAALIAVVVALASLRVTNVMTSAVLYFGMVLAVVFLIAGLGHRGEVVYLYHDGLIYVDRWSITTLRFDEVQTLEKIARRSTEAMVGRVSYRVVGGGYSFRVSGFVGDSRTLGQRLEEEVRRRGGRVI